MESFAEFICFLTVLCIILFIMQVGQEPPRRFWHFSITHVPTLGYMDIFSDNYLGIYARILEHFGHNT